MASSLRSAGLNQEEFAMGEENSAMQIGSTPQNPPDQAEFSVIVCTRNRPLPLFTLVSLLLTGETRQFDLIVIDQSDDDETRKRLIPFAGDARLRLHKSARRGKGAGLNEGLALARGRLLVCTDDDCLPPPRWASGMAETLESRPEAALAFCRVDPVAYDKSAGYVPCYQISQSRSLRTYSDVCDGLGIGAGMALRRDFIESMGGFDESFGPGARFPSADEWDLSIRALSVGRQIYETADLAIVHDGFRTFTEGKAHSRRDWVALGAVCAKPLRAGRWKAGVIPIWLFSSRALWPPLRDLLAFRRPQGAGRIWAFMRGFVIGLGTSVDARTLRFSR